MSGYVPLFATLTSGTLCGIWPDVGLWPIVLSLSDKFGVVDVTHMYLSKVTGLPETEVVACMRRFCEADPYSRTTAERGARLVLIDGERAWGWRIVNHAMYRERARKQAQQAAATESGQDAQRKRLERERASEVRRRPAESCADRLSYANANSNSNSNSQKGGANTRAARSTSTRLTDDFALTPERRAIAQAEAIDPERTFAKFRDYWLAAAGAKARKLDWDATWRNWCRSEHDRDRSNGSAVRNGRIPKTLEQLEAEEAERAKH